MFSFSTKFEMAPASDIIAARWLNAGGRVQQFVDNAVLTHAEPYTPLVTSTLSKSGRASTVIGSGMVTWNCFYARFQYYKYGDTRSYDPMRGGHWFERMKTDHKDQILDGARRMAGASR